MLRTFVILAVIGICFLLPLTDNSAYAQCKSKARCFSAGDECDYGPYDPCDNWIVWRLEFDRTSETSYGVLVLSVTGSGFSQGFLADDYAASQHHICTGSEYCGPSTEHHLYVYSSSGDHFEDVDARIEYQSSNPL